MLNSLSKPCFLADLAAIKMLPKTPKCGRPMGSNLTVIGLPKKRARRAPKLQSFRQKTWEDREQSKCRYSTIILLYKTHKESI